jgi:hypothetical protein
VGGNASLGGVSHLRGTHFGATAGGALPPVLSRSPLNRCKLSLLPPRPHIPDVPVPQSRLRVARLSQGPRRLRAIITQLRAEGYEISGTYDGADLVVVNTCGFIDEAVQESLDAIGEALTENGKVIVTGCLGAKSSASGST